MTVTFECPCGASMTIEDASEIASQDLVARWFSTHGEHRRTADEYREWVQAIHGRRDIP